MLPDTFGTEAFLRGAPPWLARWTGFRPDSAPPIEGGEEIIAWWRRMGEDPRQKLLVFSDGMDADTIERTYRHFDGRVRMSFGWGTNLTNDFRGVTPEPTRGLDPISVVCKVASANGRPAVKLSDNPAKAGGDPHEVARYKRVFGVAALCRARRRGLSRRRRSKHGIIRGLTPAAAPLGPSLPVRAAPAGRGNARFRLFPNPACFCLAYHKRAYYIGGMTTKPHRSLGFLLIDAARLLRRRFEQESRDIEMTGAQLQIVARLAKSEGISQGALAGLLDLEPMTLCRHVDRMVAADLVERRQDPHDRRARQLFTTPKSRALLEPMRARASAVFDQATQGLSSDQREALLDALETLIGNLSVQDDVKPKRREDSREPAGEIA